MTINKAQGSVPSVSKSRRKYLPRSKVSQPKHASVRKRVENVVQCLSARVYR